MSEDEENRDDSFRRAKNAARTPKGKAVAKVIPQSKASTPISEDEVTQALEDDTSAELSSAVKAPKEQATAKVAAQSKAPTPIVEDGQSQALEDGIAAGLDNIDISEAEDNNDEGDHRSKQIRKASFNEPKSTIVTRTDRSSMSLFLHPLFQDSPC